jgi:Asp-tRNA(Asn)/Glu-tRNA(Gln) amidotransferase A subunit family amidase
MAMLAAAFCNPAQAQPSGKKFEIVEATIADIQNAIKAKQLTATELVNMYLARIKAYNGTCVEEPQGILGPVSPIPNAGAINALISLNLRPDARKKWGFGDRKARSMTDALDKDSAMPDALEVAAALDAQFARTGQLAGPLHGVVLSIKDMIDTFDMRTTSGADADYANDRPPRDATLVKRVRDVGAIILAKANLGEYGSGSRSAFGGTICNPYDTARDPGGSSGGSAASVAANLVTCAISEEGGPSIRMPSRLNNGVGLSQSQGLVSRDGMIGGGGLNDRNGAACRTVEDVARVLDVIAGYDPVDDLTVYSIGRIPREGYAGFAKETRLDGIGIGVVREFMDKRLFTQADHESIDVVNEAIEDLRKLGAAIVDPGREGSLFQDCIDRHIPRNLNATFTRQFPSVFAEGADQVTALVDLYAEPFRVRFRLDLPRRCSTGCAMRVRPAGRASSVRYRRGFRSGSISSRCLSANRCFCGSRRPTRKPRITAHLHPSSGRWRKQKIKDECSARSEGYGGRPGLGCGGTMRARGQSVPCRPIERCHARHSMGGQTRPR